MVVAVILHMARAFYTAAYRPPREFNWLVGMGLLVVTLGLSFTGYLLPWDQLAYWAITIGANIAQSPREVTDALGITACVRSGRAAAAAAARLGRRGRGGADPLLPAARDDPAAGAGRAAGRPLLADPQGRRPDAAGRRRRAARAAAGADTYPVFTEAPAEDLPPGRHRARAGRRRSAAGPRTPCPRCRTCSTPNWAC